MTEDRQIQDSATTLPRPTALRAWIEAMRLRTLPVSVSGVVAAAGYAAMDHCFDLLVFVLCLLFAVLAQVASNFANEYFDFRSGLDRAGREGPRRGVTEGDITPRAMLIATLGVLGLACAIGLVLAVMGGWLILVCGIVIAAGALAYSAGPFPLSRRCLGEVAVVVFFGLAPVNLTYYLMSGYFDPHVVLGSVAVGLMGANVLLVNNIRDIADDRAVGKHTLVSATGRRFGSFLYLVNGWLAVYLMLSAWYVVGSAWLIVPGAYLILHTILWLRIDTLSGRALNPMLGATAVAMAAYVLLFALGCA